MKTTLPLLSLATLLSAVSAQAAIINIDNYSYGNAPSAFYPDSGGELTDGITDTIVWGGSETPTATTVAPLVGWQTSDPLFTINFAATETVAQISLWFADSNGASGVYLPDSVTIRNADSSYSETFAITNPAGGGDVKRFDFSLPSVTTDSLTISALNGNNTQWVMVSEVGAASVPEPSSSFLIALGLGTSILRRRR